MTLTNRLGGVSVRDEGWNETQTQFYSKLRDFFGGTIPDDFELHATDLLAPQRKKLLRPVLLEDPRPRPAYKSGGTNRS